MSPGSLKLGNRGVAAILDPVAEYQRAGGHSEGSEIIYLEKFDVNHDPIMHSFFTYLQLYNESANQKVIRCILFCRRSISLISPQYSGVRPTRTMRFCSMM